MVQQGHEHHVSTHSLSDYILKFILQDDAIPGTVARQKIYG